MKQLFIGAEGSLGIITKLAILTPPKPKVVLLHLFIFVLIMQSVNVSIFGCRDFEAVKATLGRAKKELGEILSGNHIKCTNKGHKINFIVAFEFLDQGSMSLVLKHVDRIRDPLSAKYPFYALVETSGSNKDHDREVLFLLLLPSLNNIILYRN